MTENTQSNDPNFRRCIYCRKFDNKSLFNKEHVVQKSMTAGKSIQYNLTIEPAEFYNCVCTECNTFFGNGIDSVYGRDSLEAILRHKHGLKPLSKLSELSGQRTKVRAPAEDNEDRGAWLVPIDDGNPDMLLRYVSQIKIRSKITNKFDYFSEVEFSELLDRTAEFGLAEIELVTSPKISDSELASFQKKAYEILQQMGATKAELGAISELPPGIINPPVHITLDDDLMRAIAKIAFNYLAVVLQPLDETIILCSGFDAVRDFIRYGTRPNFQVVTQAEDEPGQESSAGHIVRLQSQVIDSQMYVSARISIFRAITWEVLLNNQPVELKKIVQSCHFWDLERKVCERIYFNVA